MVTSQLNQYATPQTEPADFDGDPAVENPSYRRSKPFVLTNEVRRAIAGAVAQIDMDQMRIIRAQTIAQRVWQVASMIDAVEQITAYRLRQREPELSEEEALRIVRGGLMNYALSKTRL